MKIPFLARHSAEEKAGQPPGTLIFVGDRADLDTSISTLTYTEDGVESSRVESFPSMSELVREDNVSWVDVVGVHDPEVVRKVGKETGIPMLLLEDFMNMRHRPKIEENSEYLSIILKMLSMDDDVLRVEQVSIIVGRNYVITLQEAKGDVFDPVRERIRKAKGQIRQRGADYLAFSLLDAVVDNYFIVLERIGERLEEVEKEVMRSPEKDQLPRIHANKMDLFFIRKAIWPLREMASTLEKDSEVVSDESRPYYRDLYEHVIQVIDTVETFRDVASGIADLFMSAMGNRMNEVMQVLTIIATIFIPITFIAGIYGMNFQSDGNPWNMPELSWKYGYLGVWGVMLAVTAVMLAFFRRKKWF